MVSQWQAFRSLALVARSPLGVSSLAGSIRGTTISGSVGDCLRRFVLLSCFGNSGIRARASTLSLQEMKALKVAALGSLLVSCGSSPNPYKATYFPIATGLKRTAEVAVYAPRTQGELDALTKRFDRQVKAGEMTVVGRASLSGQSIDYAAVKELAMQKGADVVIATVWRNQSERSRRPVSYGYPATNNYYNVNPYIPPYQVAPPQGGVMEGLVQYRDAQRRWQQEDAARRQYDAQWSQPLWFLRNTPKIPKVESGPEQ